MATTSIFRLGSLSNADEKYFKHKQPMWNMNIDHTTYDEEWQSRAIWKYLKAIKPAVMLVGGWYDTEDPQGLLRQFDFMEKNAPQKCRRERQPARPPRRQLTKGMRRGAPEFRRIER